MDLFTHKASWGLQFTSLCVSNYAQIEISTFSTNLSTNGGKLVAYLVDTQPVSPKSFVTPRIWKVIPG